MPNGHSCSPDASKPSRGLWFATPFFNPLLQPPNHGAPPKNYFAHPDRSRRDLRGCDDPCWTGKRPRGGEDGGLAFGPCFRDIWSSFGRLKPPLLSHWSAKLSGEIRGQQAAAETRSSIFRGHVAWRPRSLHCSIAVSC